MSSASPIISFVFANQVTYCSQNFIQKSISFGDLKLAMPRKTRLPAGWLLAGSLIILPLAGQAAAGGPTGKPIFD